jgi:hypothetical protein
VNDVLGWMSVFSGPLNAKMVRARERCYDISGSERLLGFEESAKMYREMGDEISPLALWVNQEENRMRRDGEIPADESFDPAPYEAESVYPDC